MSNRYSVSPSAEAICNAVAFIILVCTILSGVACIVVGIIMGGEELPMLIAGGVACIVLGLISWACLKVVVNISRSLYNITDAVQKLQEAKKSEE